MSTAGKNTFIKSGMHNHCTMCDGKNTMLEMAKAAYEKGFTDFGFSSHALTPYSDINGITNDSFHLYKSEFEKVKAMFEGKIRLYLGIEQDYYSQIDYRHELNYTIGAVHEIYGEERGKAYWVDGDKQIFKNCIDEVFKGDAMKLIERYYEMIAENTLKFKPDIIAHFDLVSKNNASGEFFDKDSEQYKKLALNALGECMNTDAVFEINTGNVFRKYAKTPYPDEFILKELCKKNARITVSADAHETSVIDFYFEKSVDLLKNIGFNYIYIYFDGNFEKKMI